MRFVDHSGCAVEAAPAPKRVAVRLGGEELRLLRARTCEALRGAMTLAQLGELFNVSERTISNDLAYLQDAKEAGRNRLPWDRAQGIDDC